MDDEGTHDVTKGEEEKKTAQDFIPIIITYT